MRPVRDPAPRRRLDLLSIHAETLLRQFRRVRASSSQTAREKERRRMKTRSYSDDVRRPLTPRMLDVLRCAAEGASIAETAGELGIAPATVRSIREAACARLEAPNIIAAVHAVYRRGGTL
jgi:DNA-binding NarL/FixJ family response regulator